ncbi:group II intron maturase-specific domain-containing protein [Bacillus sp. SM2101]|uniref:group II intron maturase-specific domain-containing protein n=1 Tax=Bacillus sp. SM2101 TaxID=2805366 RepID=UPI001BDEDD1A|nr:group II intron maturase-specific domain-containing protein [Bacillus sp. SM2101]
METKLLRIAEIAKSNPKMKFTSLAYLLNKQALAQCHYELPNRKATGINGTTKEIYGESLEENLDDLVSRMKSKSYRPVPVRRMYIPKVNSSKKRPLGIPEHEDKVVQKGITKILNTIYENDFLGFTHYCSKSKQGKFRVKRKSSRTKVQSKLKESKEWLKKNRNKDIHIIMDRFRRSLIGYYNYYCITDNTINVSIFKGGIEKLLFKWLNRRSQRKSFTWDKFRLFLDKYPLPSPRIKVNIYDLRKDISYFL